MWTPSVPEMMNNFIVLYFFRRVAISYADFIFYLKEVLYKINFYTFIILYFFRIVAVLFSYADFIFYLKEVLLFQN